MKITEYTIVGTEDNRPIMIYLGEGNYYAGYDNETGVKATKDQGFALRFANEKFALEEIGLLQNFFDENGNVVKENASKTIPPLVGLSEAAEMLGWDKRKVSTYMGRGVFPEPLQRLASGPVWTYKQIEDYKKERDINE